MSIYYEQQLQKLNFDVKRMGDHIYIVMVKDLDQTTLLKSVSMKEFGKSYFGKYPYHEVIQGVLSEMVNLIKLYVHDLRQFNECTFYNIVAAYIPVIAEYKQFSDIERFAGVRHES